MAALGAAPDAIPAGGASSAFSTAEQEPSGAAPSVAVVPGRGGREVVEGTELTRREYEVIRRFALGQTWKQIVVEMGIRRNTIASHRGNAMEKYGVSCLADLWRELGWLTIPPAVS